MYQRLVACCTAEPPATSPPLLKGPTQGCPGHGAIWKAAEEGMSSPPAPLSLFQALFRGSFHLWSLTRTSSSLPALVSSLLAHLCSVALYSPQSRVQNTWPNSYIHPLPRRLLRILWHNIVGYSWMHIRFLSLSLCSFQWPSLKCPALLHFPKT